MLTTDLTPISFIELASRLGAYMPASAALSYAYAKAEVDGDEPHGVPWHTSHHASEIPYDERWCERKLVFGLMGVPAGDAPDEMGRCIMDAGKDAEDRFVARYHQAGLLKTNAPDAPLQTNFIDSEAWLSGSPDAGIVPPGWSNLHITDFKGKDNERDAFSKLANGEAQPDPKHIAQVQVYLNMAERDEIFTGILRSIGIGPPETGSVVYFNRARPHQRVEFFFEIDREMYEEARRRLIKANESFLDGVLPKHPFDGKEWSVPPCQFCPLKKVTGPGGVTGCKQMWKDGVKTLDEAAEHVKNVFAGYNYTDKREAVLARWE